MAGERLAVACQPNDAGWTCEVGVGEGSGATRHRVTVDADTLAELAPSHAAPDDLVRRSFEFLLEREPSTSILSTFELTAIERYFPGYRGEIRRRLES